MTDKENESAAEFNEMVWNDPRMGEAVRAAESALGELRHGKGWGLLSLEAAEGALEFALSQVRYLKTLKTFQD